MRSHINRLHKLSQKSERLIIGLMSGTSLDGLDIALCRVRGQGVTTELELINFKTLAYDNDYRNKVRQVFSTREVDLQNVCMLNPWIALEHSKKVMHCLNEWKLSPADIDLVASHGQTIYHAPKHLHQQSDFPNSSLQIGDGDHLAYDLGIITISDFRQKHLAAGGEGAPLAMYGDFLIFSDSTENRILLNIGGIANLTWLPRSLCPGDVMSTDIGPGNTIMDAFIQQQFKGRFYDENAELARAGKVSPSLLTALKEDAFFNTALPKTIGPELFNLNYLHSALSRSGKTKVPDADLLATLNKFSADTIALSILESASAVEDFVIYASGGGIHNPLLLENIEAQLPGVSIQSTQALGIDPDAKEAVLFAVLANECVAGENPLGLGASLSCEAAVAKPVTMGKISFPD